MRSGQLYLVRFERKKSCEFSVFYVKKMVWPMEGNHRQASR